MQLLAMRRDTCPAPPETATQLDGDSDGDDDEEGEDGDEDGECGLLGGSSLGSLWGFSCPLRFFYDIS